MRNHFLRAAGKTLWTPAQIATALWLDAADNATVFSDAGTTQSIAGSSTVQQWNDKSGNSRNATQATSGNRPAYQNAAQNGLNSLRFTASSQHSMAAGAAGTWNFLHDGTSSSLFIVAKVRNTGEDPVAQHALIDTGGASAFNSGFTLFYDDTAGAGNNTIRVLVPSATNSYSVIATSADQIVPGNCNTINALVDADNLTAANRLAFRINGNPELKPNTQTSSPRTANSTFALNLGRIVHDNSLHLTGDICEVLLLLNQPDTNIRQRIEGYLAHKWSLTANLPADHPYKVAAPT